MCWKEGNNLSLPFSGPMLSSYAPQSASLFQWRSHGPINAIEFAFCTELVLLRLDNNARQYCSTYCITSAQRRALNGDGTVLSLLGNSGTAVPYIQNRSNLYRSEVLKPVLVLLFRQLCILPGKFLCQINACPYPNRLLQLINTLEVAGLRRFFGQLELRQRANDSARRGVRLLVPILQMKISTRNAAPR